MYLISPHGCCAEQHGGLRVLLLFLIHFTYMYQTNYLKIYSTDLRQIFKVDKTVAVDDQFEVSL